MSSPTPPIQSDLDKIFKSIKITVSYQLDKLPAYEMDTKEAETAIQLLLAHSIKEARIDELLNIGYTNALGLGVYTYSGFTDIQDRIKELQIKSKGE